MPCLNEARTLGGCIAKALHSLRANAIRGEVLIADNGSHDGSARIAAEAGARVIHVPRAGYGAALAAGIDAARGRYVIIGDSDGSYDMGLLMPFLERLRQGSELVMGNRFRGRIDPGAMPVLHRYLGNPALSAIGRRFFGSRCGDFYCGQRGFVRQAALRMDLRAQGMEFALEMLIRATRLKMRIDEVPVHLGRDGRGRPSHLRTWRDGWRSLRLFLLHSPRWLYLHPGLALMATGTALGASILPGPRQIAGVKLDVHTLLYCSVAISLGFQLVAFYLFGQQAALVAPGPRSRAMKPGWLSKMRLEYGLALAGLLVGLGVAGSVWATVVWARRDFGALDPFIGMRWAIPSALLITLGFQVACSSFYLGLLAWNRHLSPGPGVAPEAASQE